MPVDHHHCFHHFEDTCVRVMPESQCLININRHHVLEALHVYHSGKGSKSLSKDLAYTVDTSRTSLASPHLPNVLLPFDFSQSR